MRRLLPNLSGPLLFLFLLPSPGIRSAPAPDSTPVPTGFNTLLQPGRHVMSIRVDDYDRKFVFITPKGFKSGDALPLLFCFHGGGGQAGQAAQTYGWAEKAGKEHFFAVFPEGLARRPAEKASFGLNPRLWRTGRPDFQTPGVNDVHFFAALLDQLEAALPVDRRRIYVTGFSNGAGMTFTLGARFSDRIAAIAPVASKMYVEVQSLARPLPVYYLVGKSDPVVPFLGGQSSLPLGGTQMPVQASVDAWVKLDGCPPQPRVVIDENGLRIARYGPGRGKSEILFTTIEGNGHHWPGSVEPLPHGICGPTLDPFNATDRIWEFFKAHPLP